MINNIYYFSKYIFIRFLVLLYVYYVNDYVVHYNDDIITNR